mmetsp:Transcript_42743/g.65678  ORF Transcript_42743/g.65678 Transcript_42743/m.65678 type:complete len:149 (-) Transcript_42743:343-789(-)|eukprot:CAMPEP_0170505298 /NCGR_PEP_ID=MMETSP0208-20121228/50413_1 /TAXON_ID=197538 /ORGANISM="Strombidium inclinatum, Strain S3" /LENGTH=148 /DNA_ID=CAMNT_0010786063 /DNA_START=412 /DNA_END=858 /DNA_ORIENTATION=-
MSNQVKQLKKMGPSILESQIFSTSQSYVDFFFRDDCVLAYTMGIKMLNSTAFPGSDLLRSLSFKKVIQLNNLQMSSTTMDEIVGESGQSLRLRDINSNPSKLFNKKKRQTKEHPFKDPIISHKSPHDLVFIQAPSKIIEKQLVRKGES